MSKAKIRIQVTLEIDVPNTWGGDCTVDIINRQAKEEAKQILRGPLAIDGLECSRVGRTHIARIVSEPKVVMTILDGE